MIALMILSNGLLAEENQSNHTTEEFQISTPKSNLNAVLYKKNESAKSPVVILLHGSDRGTIDDYEEFALGMLNSGYAILSYDSPGKGKSTGNSFGETFEDRLKEVRSIIDHLKTRSDIEANMIGLWGISQGGWICQYAAASFDDVAFIIPVSGPGVGVVDQEIYRVEQQSIAAGLSEREVKKAVLIRKLLVDAIAPHPVFELEIENENYDDVDCRDFKSMIYGGLPEDSVLTNMLPVLERIQEKDWAFSLHIEHFLPVLKSMPPQAWPAVKVQFAQTMSFEPTDYLRKIKVPTLAIFGDKDLSVPVKESVMIYKSEFRKSGNNDLRVIVFEDADHGIRVKGERGAKFYPSINDWLKNLYKK